MPDARLIGRLRNRKQTGLDAIDQKIAFIQNQPNIDHASQRLINQLQLIRRIFNRNPLDRHSSW